MTKKITQTAGRAQLGDFAPTFAHLNDDVLFGKVWNEEAIDLKTKCIITVVSLMASGITDSSLGYHLQNAKNNGVTKEEIAAIMAGLRADPPKDLCGSPVTKVIDYLEPEKTGQPKSNVLQFFDEAGDVVSVRPSGTEPKIKFYFGAKGADADDKIAALKAQFCS